MGGINCGGARPKSCYIAENEIENLRLAYASVVKNVFQINAYFSLANVHVEEIMSLEKTAQHTLAFAKYEDVKQNLLTSWNASVALDDFFKNLNAVQSDADLSNDEVLILKEMSLTNTKMSDLIYDLYNAYEVMPYEKLLMESQVHEYLRHGSITKLTEDIVGLLSQELVFLKKYSVTTKEVELINS
ncbi:hypothetical protein [Leuconostoc gasicomitatum]|uniref:hypothetical protein n=1 Tax=Leuconostoc gasicomitatum TaxID=115778 RepID=UPI0007E06409|nr:hypothetical protein [Leuconostoc gasicomitatum]CUW16309.1 hypothetical protein PB1E_1891 [Leuconostoc gasicomitatum]